MEKEKILEGTHLDSYEVQRVGVEACEFLQIGPLHRVMWCDATNLLPDGSVRVSEAEYLEFWRKRRKIHKKPT